jgi:hypothetical protein
MRLLGLIVVTLSWATVPIALSADEAEGRPVVPVGTDLGTTEVGGRSYSIIRGQDAAGGETMWAIDVATGEIFDDTQFAAVVQTAIETRGKFTNGALAALDARKPIDLGFFLGGLDYAPAVSTVEAAHPEVKWEDGVPVEGARDDIRAARHDLMVAKAEIVRAAEKPFVAAADAITAGGSAAFDLAPLVMVRATKEQAETLAARPEVAQVRLSSPPAIAMASAYGDVQAAYSHSTLGFTGSGARIGIVEYEEVDWSKPGLAQVGANKLELYVGGNDPNFTCVVGHPPNDDLVAEHMTRVTAVAAGRAAAGTTSGIAPGAFIVSSSANTHDVDGVDADRRIIKAVECALINGDADLITVSLVQNLEQSIGEAYFDHLTFEHQILAVAITGNYVSTPTHCANWVVRSPGSGWNVVTVGALNDNNDSVWSNDEPWYTGPTGSTPAYCYLQPPAEVGDSVNDRVKPEILAPGQSISIAGYGNQSGTSFAGPMVAGAAALVMDQQSSLIAKPETVKAILLASSEPHRVNPRGAATFSTELEGAGSLTTKWANLVVAGSNPGGAHNLGSYGLKTLVSAAMLNGCWVGPDNNLQNFTAEAGRKMRFLIVWNAHTSGHGSTVNTRWADLALSIRNPSGVLVTPDATSWNNKVASNVEWVDFTAAVSGNYQARIDSTRWGCGIQSERVGFAWVSFNPSFP